MNKLFTGTGVAMTTPFKKDKSIDFDALERLIKHVENHVDYLVVMGTTGEAAVLSNDEKTEVVNFVKQKNTNQLPIVLGIGGNNTQAVISTIQNTDLKGIAGILSVTPYYNKPSQQGLYNHYKAISEASPVPIILYNVPGRTSVNLAADTVIKLANECKNIVAVKEASGNFSQIMQIIKHKPQGFKVLSGDDALTLPLISAGMDGVISVTANAFPKEFASMTRLALQGNFEQAKEYHYQLLDFTEALFKQGNPGGIKCALEILGISANELRPPLAPIDATLYNEIKEEMERVR